MPASRPPSRTVDRPAARLEDIGLSFGDLTVLEDVSLTVPANTVTSLVGPNGSGKTTLAQVLVGVLAPDSGSRMVSTDSERPVGYLPQSPRFRPVLTVEETLEFYARLLDTAVDVEHVLEQVGLIGARDRRVDTLSGGMRQLLGIAQSILGRPSLVVLDEPTSGLDPRMKRNVFDIVSEMATDGTAVLLTTHDLASAEASDRVALLNQGRIILNESPDEFRTHTNTESLLDAFLATVGRDPSVQTGRDQ